MFQHTISSPKQLQVFGFMIKDVKALYKTYISHTNNLLEFKLKCRTCI